MISHINVVASRKVQPGEFTEILDCSSIIGPCSLNSAIENAKIYFLAARYNIGAVRLAVFERMKKSKRPFISRLTVNPHGSIVGILSVCTYPKIIISVIQSVIVFVIHFLSSPTHNLIVHENSGDFFTLTNKTDGVITFSIRSWLCDPSVLDQFREAHSPNYCHFTSSHCHITTSVVIYVKDFIRDFWTLAEATLALFSRFLFRLAAFTEIESLPQFHFCCRMYTRLGNLLSQMHDRLRQVDCAVRPHGHILPQMVEVAA
jgi:hypothetical protein